MHTAAPVPALAFNLVNAGPVGAAPVDPVLAQHFSNLMDLPVAGAYSARSPSAAAAAGGADWQWKSKLVDMGKEMNNGFVSFDNMRAELFQIMDSTRGDFTLTQIRLADFAMRSQESMSRLHWSSTLASACVNSFHSVMKQHQG